MNVADDQDRRIEAILGHKEDLDFDEAVGTFFEHLKVNLQLPCDVTGIEDFRWEEPYILGVWDRAEHERLKKTQPSFEDRYKLLSIDRDTVSEWMLFRGEDIAAHVRRIPDGRKFVLGLSELEATDPTSANYQLIDDYAVWLVNNR